MTFEKRIERLEVENAQLMKHNAKEDIKLREETYNNLREVLTKDLSFDRSARNNTSLLKPSYSEDRSGRGVGSQLRSLSNARQSSRYLMPTHDNKRLEIFMNELFSL